MLQRLKMFWDYRIMDHHHPDWVEFFLNVLVGSLFWSAVLGFVLAMFLLGPYSLIVLGVVFSTIMCVVCGWILRL